MSELTVRAFIAIELPETLKSKLSQLQGTFKKAGGSVKWVEPAGMHLTLKFLGDVAVERIEEINRAIAEGVAGITPFQLKVEGMGAFPGLKRIQVIWMGLTGDVAKLAKLQEQVEFNMALLGFPEEERAFTPHLTLGRVRDRLSTVETEKFGQLLTGTKFTSEDAIEVRSISVVRSQLSPKGATYTIISTIPLESA